MRGLFYHTGIGRPSTCVVVCHGYSSGKHNVDPLAFHLAADGFCALCFDFLGHKLGASTGSLVRAADLVSNARDAVNCAVSQDGVDRIVLAGHSMGAAAAIGAVLEGSPVEGVIVMSTALNRHRSLESDAMLSGLRNRAAYVAGADISQIMQVMDACTARIAEVAPKPLLVIAAKRDALVAPSSVERLFGAAREPKAFELIDATHTDCAERARFVIGKWLDARGFMPAALNDQS